MTAYDADSTNPSKYEAVKAYEDVTEVPLPFRAYDAVKAYDAVSWLTIEGVTVILPEWMSIDPDTVKLPATVAKSICADVPIKVIAPNVVYVSTTDVVNVTRSVAVEATINVSVVAPCISVTEVPSASEEKSTPPLLIVVRPFWKIHVLPFSTIGGGVDPSITPVDISESPTPSDEVSNTGMVPVVPDTPPPFKAYDAVNEYEEVSAYDELIS